MQHKWCSVLGSASYVLYYCRNLIFAALSVSLLFASVSAQADPQSQSHSSWKLVNDQLRMRYTVSAREVSRFSSSSDLAILQNALLRHLSEKISVRQSQSGCPAVDGGKLRAAKRGYFVAEIVFACPASLLVSEPIDVQISAFFDEAPSHIHFARFPSFGQRQQEHLFTQHQRTYSLDLRSAEPGSADFSEQNIQGVGPTIVSYVVLGFQHILEGLDHIVFLLALLLLASSAREIFLIVTGFTVGHSITLSLAVLNVVQANTLLVEATIGLTIALVAVENVAARAANRRVIVSVTAASLLLLASLPVLLPQSVINGPPALSLFGLALFSYCYLSLSDTPRRAMRYRPAITLLFGMVHGFGFANVLQEVGIPSDRVVAALFGFNVGVELGQLLIVMSMALFGYVVAQMLKNGHRTVATDLVSAILCAVGSYWFIQRAYL